LNEFYSNSKTKALDQFKTKCMWHEMQQTDFINPKLI
jgi:hypothetical protein